MVRTGPLKVVRVVTRLNVGGPSYQAIYLTQRLQDEAFQSHLLIGSTSASEGNMETLADERGVRYTRVPGLGREISLKSDLMTCWRVYREMRRTRPHIVHTHMAKAGTVGRLAARAARVPAIVHTYHGHVFHGYFSKRKTEFFLRIERALAHRTDRIVVLSESQKREILGYGVGSDEKLRIIPLGLELEPFLNAASLRGNLRQELGLPSDAPLVGIIARLVPIKAHGCFLEAAAQIARRLPDTRFLVVGDGELREGLEAQALDLGLPVVSYRDGGPPVVRQPERPVVPETSGGSVHFLGFRSDLAQIYADLDVVTLCSLNEGLPVTLIEALAAARPAVSTEVGAVRELIVPGETGMLAPVENAGALAAAVLQQLEHRESAERMAANGRERVYPRLSIQRLEQDIRALYRELASAKGLAA